VNATYFFGYRKGLGGVWAFGAFHTIHVCDLQATENNVRSKERRNFDAEV